MVDLAKQAFNTNNFDLAADIYERQITERGPNPELYLGLGDSLARAGQLKRAFEAYKHAFRLGKVKPERLSNLVTALIETMSKNEEKKAKTEEVDPFACGLCKSLWSDPVTLPCGHTFCRKCLQKDENTKQCKVCKMVHKRCRLSELKTNVFLSQIIEKWFPHELTANKLKAQGNRLFKEKDYKQAIEVYTKALHLAPNDHLVASNRSYAFASLDMWTESLQDAELAVTIRPDWSKAYFRKAEALQGVGRNEEAAFAYLQCLTLDTSVISAKTALAESLHKVLSPLPSADLKVVGNILNPASVLWGHNTQGLLSEATMAQLKTTLQESMRYVDTEQSVRQGGNFAESLNSADQNNGHSAMEQGESSSEQTMSEPTPMFKIPAHVDSVHKCSSVPPSPPSSPLLGDIKRSSSDVHLHLAVNKLNRKRAMNDNKMDTESSASNVPPSPTRAAPPKHKKDDPSPGQSTGHGRVPPQILDKEDFECALCFRLLHNPVSTPCGHTFCHQCLDRSLDHTAVCPLCKSSLQDYLAERRSTVTEAIEMIIKKYFPKDHIERKEVYEKEMAEFAKMSSQAENNIVEIPVFVCALAFPKIACPLHVFEPRYRLMIRQCMESGTRQFGMALGGEGDAPFADYGTVLEVRDVQYFPDGRSVVDTIGGRRFKVVSRGMRDGYHTAKVEFLKDNVNIGPALTEVQKIHDDIYKEAREWFNAIPGLPQGRILQHFGPFPEEESLENQPNGPAWQWWLTAVLPLNPRAQLTILAMTSMKDRLLAIKRVLKYAKRNNIM